MSSLNLSSSGYRKGYQDVNFPKLPCHNADFTGLAKVIRGEKEFTFPPAHGLATRETVLRASGLPLE